MANTIFILGAGASVSSRAPLMAEFLDVARDVVARGRAEESQAAFELAFKGIAELQLAHSKATLDLRNIEAVFAAFEMAVLFGRLGSLTPGQVQGLPDAMRQLIVKTLDVAVRFPIRRGPATKDWTGEPKREAQVAPPSPYDSLGRFLSVLRENGEAISIITFNYDLGVDYGLSFNNFVIDYCLADAPTDHNVIQLLKLHGSTNWARCAECGTVIPWQVRDIVKDCLAECRVKGVRLEKEADVRLPVRGHLAAIQHCGGTCLAEPLIVPPTWNKGGHYEAIKQVWQRAAANLHAAENIFVIGYSWPTTDHFFHHLYALGTAGPTLLRRFWLIDPSEETEARYRRLLGEQARQRFTWKKGKFEECFDQLAAEYRLSESQRKAVLLPLHQGAGLPGQRT